MLTGYNPSLML